MKFKLFVTVAVVLLAIGLLVQARAHWSLMVNLALAKDEILRLQSDHDVFRSQIQDLQQKLKIAAPDPK